MTKQVHWLDTSPYNARLLLFVGSRARMAAYVKRQFNCDAGPDIHAAETFGIGPKDAPETVRVIWIPSLGTVEDALSASHETLHAAWRILDLVGVKVDVDNSEALVYFHEHLLRQVLMIAAAR